MLLCPFLLEESESRHQSTSDVDETGYEQGGSVVVPPEIGQQADSPAPNGNLIKACGIAIGAPILWEISCADLWVGSVPRGSSLTRSDACPSRYAGFCGARTSYRLRGDMGWLGYGETLN